MESWELEEMIDVGRRGGWELEEMIGVGGEVEGDICQENTAVESRHGNLDSDRLRDVSIGVSKGKEKLEMVSLSGG